MSPFERKFYTGNKFFRGWNLKISSPAIFVSVLTLLKCRPIGQMESSWRHFFRSRLMRKFRNLPNIFVKQWITDAHNVIIKQWIRHWVLTAGGIQPTASRHRHSNITDCKYGIVVLCEISGPCGVAVDITRQLSNICMSRDVCDPPTRQQRVICWQCPHAPQIPLHVTRCVQSLWIQGDHCPDRTREQCITPMAAGSVGNVTGLCHCQPPIPFLDRAVPPNYIHPGAWACCTHCQQATG